MLSPSTHNVYNNCCKKRQNTTTIKPTRVVNAQNVSEIEKGTIDSCESDISMIV